MSINMCIEDKTNFFILLILKLWHIRRLIFAKFVPNWSHFSSLKKLKSILSFYISINVYFTVYMH